MLILPPGHAQRVAQRRPFTRREKWLVSGAGVAVLALVVAVVIALASTSPKSGHGCVYVTVASSMGAQPLSGCGAKARSICAEVGVPGVYGGSLRSDLLAACRTAGLPVRSP